MKFGIFLIKSCTIAILCVIVLEFLGTQLSPTSGQGAPSPVTQQRPGDVNCDERLDITDAVHLLRFLFQDGEPPCAVAQEKGQGVCPELLAGIAETNALLRSLKPHPRDLFSYSEDLELAGGELAIIANVPEGKWLVITEITIRQTSNMYIVEIEEGAAANVKIRPPDFIRPGDNSPYLFQAAEGIAFRPGTRVALRNNRGGVSGTSLRVSGYFVAD